MERIFEAGKPVAVICHGARVIVEADRVLGRTLTSWPSLQTDIRGLTKGEAVVKVLVS